MMNTHTDSFPPPPKEFYQAIREAGLAGLWVKAGHRATQRRGRFIVTAPHGRKHLFTHDDIEEVRAWISCKTNTGPKPPCLTL